ncbi:MAG: hypothetical protein HY360_21450 [Verrucomicrobia bacterium]|nr:hypothetical protein [Verrucomicrobiota bacterium]
MNQTNTRKLTGIADVDTALQQQEPNAQRWDFAIGYQHTNRKAECVYWVEIHTASDKENWSMNRHVNAIAGRLR